MSDSDNEGLVTFLIAFAMTALVVFMGINHAKTLDSIEKGEVVKVFKQSYICRKVTE